MTHTPWHERKVMCADGVIRTNAEIAAYIHEQTWEPDLDEVQEEPNV